MASSSSILAAIAAAVALAGCVAAQTPPADTGAIDLPLAELMQPPARQIPIPPQSCEADPLCRSAEYYAPHRAQCGAYRDGQIGLQSYVRALHAKRGSSTP